MPYLMNGTPLPPAHGYPLRLFIPDKYGMKQPKWITEIELVDHEFIGYFEAQSWSNESCRQALAAHKVPAAIRFVPALAMTASGKLARR